MVLTAKKKIENRNFKFRENDVYFNDHLTPKHKELFSAARTKKFNNNYKYLWTRNGRIFIRKTDVSEVIRVTSEEVVNSL